MADPGRDMILEPVHFLMEIRNPRHARLSGMLSIRSYAVTPQRPSRRNLPARSPCCGQKDLIDFDPGGLDDSLPLVGVLFQKLRKVVRGGALDRICVTCKLLNERRRGQSF